MIFRDPPQRAAHLMERSTVFQPLRLIKLGGLYPDSFLENRGDARKNGQALDVARMKDNSNGLTLSAEFRQSDDDRNPIVFESDWIANPVKNSPAYLPMEVRQSLSDQSNSPPMTRVNWTWDDELLKQGYALPSSYDIVVRSPENLDRVRFERNVTLKSWIVNPKLNESDFSVQSLSPNVGEPVDDR